MLLQDFFVSARPYRVRKKKKKKKKKKTEKKKKKKPKSAAYCSYYLKANINVGQKKTTSIEKQFYP